MGEGVCVTRESLMSKVLLSVREEPPMHGLAGCNSILHAPLSVHTHTQAFLQTHMSLPRRLHPCRPTRRCSLHAQAFRRVPMECSSHQFHSCRQPHAIPAASCSQLPAHLEDFPWTRKMLSISDGPPNSASPCFLQHMLHAHALAEPASDVPHESAPQQQQVRGMNSAGKQTAAPLPLLAGGRGQTGVCPVGNDRGRGPAFRSF